MKREIIIVSYMVIVMIFASINVVSSNQEKRILFDERGLYYSKEYEQYMFSIMSTFCAGYSTMANSLKDEGYKLDIHKKGNLTLSELRKYNVIVIANRHEYTFYEKKAIKEFYELGGLYYFSKVLG